MVNENEGERQVSMHDPAVAAFLPILADTAARISTVNEASILDAQLIGDEMDPAQAIRLLTDLGTRQAEVFVRAIGALELEVRELHRRAGESYPRQA